MEGGVALLEEIPLHPSISNTLHKHTTTNMNKVMISLHEPLYNSDVPCCHKNHLLCFLYSYLCKLFPEDNLYLSLSKNIIPILSNPFYLLSPVFSSKIKGYISLAHQKAGGKREEGVKGAIISTCC